MHRARTPGPARTGSARAGPPAPGARAGELGGQIGAAGAAARGLHLGEQEQVRTGCARVSRAVPGGRAPEEAPHHAQKRGGHEHPAAK